MRTPSLRWRIVGAVALLLVATNVVVGAVTVIAYREYLVGRLDAELATAAGRTPGGQPPSGPPPESSDGQQDPDNRFIGAPGQAADTVVAVLRDGAAVLAGYTDGAGAQHGLSRAQEAVLADVAPDATPTTVSLGSLGAYRAQAVTRGGEVFVTALPLGDLRASVVRLVVVIGSTTLLALLVAAWALTLAVRRSLRPLERVASVASSVTALDLERGDADIAARVPSADLVVSREVGQVGTALNRLLGHVGRALTVRRDAERGMRTFVADASHELRTPIATVRAYAELSAGSQDVAALQRNAERIGREAVRMGDLVEELLLLARLDAATHDGAAPDAAALTARPGTVHEEVDLTATVVEAVMDARATAPDHRWMLQLADDRPLTVSGDPGQLRRAVTNLLANARTHTPAGTTVVVSLQRVPRTGGDEAATGGLARLVVANDGPPIDAEVLPVLFDRFTRGSSSRSREHGTSGLGLAIVRAVVTAHGGSVRVVSEPGRTAFTVDLPEVGDRSDA
ncbi:HAMP domain-containing sensor histidine kinase [Curtobacterium sp. BRD11]|uniref:sensor histidine kinase n=1 Tax=Curtobacterium sp. BRD11 TaxID=2962581 RepID=UPI002881F4BA|nr:HAMP domain-containing sensor histidine kinase [Curtobacterium sp. BRD11]MDT0211962.1 HAMP domain-containing sensor histidine kinase [Curtobacterium sp. BRD11]